MRKKVGRPVIDAFDSVIAQMWHEGLNGNQIIEVIHSFCLAQKLSKSAMPSRSTIYRKVKRLKENNDYV